MVGAFCGSDGNAESGFCRRGMARLIIFKFSYRMRHESLLLRQVVRFGTRRITNLIELVKSPPHRLPAKLKVQTRTPEPHLNPQIAPSWFDSVLSGSIGTSGTGDSERRPAI